MRIPFSIFLALKYLRPKRTFLSMVTVLSVTGVMLGVAVLLVVLSVMSGFDDLWRDKILSFNAHILLNSYGPIEDADSLIERVKQVPGVRGAAPYVQGLVFLQHDERIYTPFLRGVDPRYEVDVTKVAEHITEGAFDVNDGDMVLGKDLARRMGVGVGDTILVYSPQHFAHADEIQMPEELTITGIFDLGMYDFDMGFVLTGLPTARSLCGLETGVHGLQVMTDDPFKAGQVASRLITELGPAYDVQTWMSLNRQLFAALRVEKNMMFFLLIFITVVAAFGITNTLITVTVQKTREIGLLKSLGFSSGAVMRVFLWQGLVDGVFGTVLGTGFGLLMLHYRNDLLRVLSSRLGYELFPKELYHLTEIPARTSSSDILLIAGTVLVICTLAGVIPAWRAARLDPVKALRYE